jgi:hypothetical protein
MNHNKIGPPKFYMFHHTSTAACQVPVITCSTTAAANLQSHFKSRQQQLAQVFVITGSPTGTATLQSRQKQKKNGVRL